MSILIDFIQRIILYGAYELTCSVIMNVLKSRWIVCRFSGRSRMVAKSGATTGGLEVNSGENRRARSNVIDIEVPDTPGGLNRLELEVEPSCNGVELQPAESHLDAIDKHLGPISPPKTSCMRLARNSYFS